MNFLNKLFKVDSIKENQISLAVSIFGLIGLYMVFTRMSPEILAVLTVIESALALYVVGKLLMR